MIERHNEISADDLTARMGSGQPFALLDVREYGEYNAAHIPGASAVPRRMLEARAAELIPHPNVPIAVYDDDGRRANLAATTLMQMGYRRVGVLAGGINRWASQGHPTEWGVNVPSKDFGEKVEILNHVPTITADELQAQIEQGEPILIVDTRTPEEFQRACIPGGRSVPGAEIALRIHDLMRERPDAKVVVNCAGRTRSIIGTRTLQRMGIEHAVGLQNGTSGWSLAGYQLEHNSSKIELPEPSEEGRAAAEAYARRVAQEDGVEIIGVHQLKELIEQRENQPVFLIDVRTEEEFAAGHIPGFRWTAGGQAVQRADDTVAVRAASIVFCCDGVTRSFVTASWYRQIGFFKVYAVEGGTSAWVAAGEELESGPVEQSVWGLAEAMKSEPALSPQDMALIVSNNPHATVIFVDTSREFAQGHIPGARWLSRSWLEIEIENIQPDLDQPVLVTDTSGTQAFLAAETLHRMGYRRIRTLAGGMKAWKAAGLGVELGLSGVMDPPNDVVPAGTERTYADMVEYLRWEENLGRKYLESSNA